MCQIGDLPHRPAQGLGERDGADRAFTVKPQTSGQVAALGLRSDGLAAERGKGAPGLYPVPGGVVDMSFAIGLLPQITLHSDPQFTSLCVVPYLMCSHMLNVSAHLRQCPYRMTVTGGYASTTIVCVASTRNLPKAQIGRAHV